MTFDGELETHLTIAAPHADGAEFLRAWAARHGMKYTHIVLARGATPSQPMLTSAARGSLPQQLAAAADLTARLASDGFVVARVKVEAAPWNADVPQTDAAARREHGHRYFEHHVKLCLAPGHDVAALAALATRHDAHVSRNALRTRHDGREERFVTQRCHRVGRDSARVRFDALLNDLASRGYEVIEAEAEFVVYDSDLGLDAGWIDNGDDAPAGQGGPS